MSKKRTAHLFKTRWEEAAIFSEFDNFTFHLSPASNNSLEILILFPSEQYRVNFDNWENLQKNLTSQSSAIQLRDTGDRFIKGMFFCYINTANDSFENIVKALSWMMHRFFPAIQLV